MSGGADLLTDQRYKHGVDLFNRGEYFACHEALEAIWTATRGANKYFLQSLIHFAVGHYHHERGNREGAVPQLRKGIKKVAGYLPVYGGIDTQRLYQDGQAWLAAVRDGAEAPPATMKQDARFHYAQS